LERSKATDELPRPNGRRTLPADCCRGCQLTRRAKAVRRRYWAVRMVADEYALEKLMQAVGALATGQILDSFVQFPYQLPVRTKSSNPTRSANIKLRTDEMVAVAANFL
jgi:hypothetical protein